MDSKHQFSPEMQEKIKRIEKRKPEFKEEIEFIENYYGIALIDFETALNQWHYLEAMQKYKKLFYSRNA